MQREAGWIKRRGGGRMRTAVRLLVVLLLSAGVAFAPVTLKPVEAQSGWTLYDNFNSLLINPNKWFGRTETEGSGPFLEIFRGLVAGGLVLSQRLYGAPIDESINFHALSAWTAQNPEQITGMRVRLSVRHNELTTCAANGEVGSQRVRLEGIFFSAGTPEPGNPTDNVNAQVEVFRRTDSLDALNVFRVRGRVLRWIDPAFNADELTRVDLGTLNVGQSTVVSLRWDPSNARFLFRRDLAPEIPVYYPWSNNNPPSDPNKGLVLRSIVENCSALRTVGSIIVSFDDFYVTH